MKLKLFILLLAVGLAALAQAPPVAPDPVREAETAKLRANVLKLLEMEGIRENLQQRIKTTMPESKANMRQACEKCAPEFAEEW